MSETQEIRCKRLVHRSRYRGVKESDLLFGQFADTHLASLDDGQLDRYEALLDEPDQDVLAWVYGRAACARRDTTTMCSGCCARFEPDA